jgi:sugar/nucleoside kinase (ribokinase family)
VDTTAAGDIFHGAFAFALLEDREFAAALAFASAAAGLSVQRPGGRDSIPGLAETRKAEVRIGGGASIPGRFLPR